MNDKKWIIAGLIVFLVLFTFPLWFNIGHKAPAPDVKLAWEAKAIGECILPKQKMRVQHMQILDEWREKVVRQGVREYQTPTGKTYQMSLSNTCLGCHTNKEEFCDRCHNYVSVRTYCWDCHVDPAKGLKETAQWKTAEEISLR
jgi:hypothetical protein